MNIQESAKVNTDRGISCENATSLIKSHFLGSYSNKEVLYWPILWFLATVGFIQAQTCAKNIVGGKVKVGERQFCFNFWNKHVLSVSFSISLYGDFCGRHGIIVKVSTSC